MGVTLNSKEIKGKVNTTGLIATVGLIGSRGEKGDQGEQGNDGFSPIITTSKSGKVTTLTITDASGTKTATINDGADGQGSGDMLTSVYDQNLNGIVDNAEKVNNHTVESDVPSNAVFTDTTYTAGTGIDITNNVISNTQTSAEWGNITGTLNSQTDLKNALDAKQDIIDSSNKLPYSYISGTPTIPTKLSDLTNDNNTVTDASYVHTDNNYTTSEKTKLSGIEAGAEVNVSEIAVGTDTPTEDTKLQIETMDLDANYETNDIYSTDEVKTNKIWIDGKPIYRKVYTTYTLETGTTNDNIILETDINKNIINSYGYLYLTDSAYNFKVTISTPDAGFGLITNVMRNRDGVMFLNRTHGAYGVLTEIAIVVEYTKTS